MRAKALSKSSPTPEAVKEAKKKAEFEYYNYFYSDYRWNKVAGDSPFKKFYK